METQVLLITPSATQRPAEDQVAWWDIWRGLVVPGGHRPTEGFLLEIGVAVFALKIFVNRKSIPIVLKAKRKPEEVIHFLNCNLPNAVSAPPFSETYQNRPPFLVSCKPHSVAPDGHKHCPGSADIYKFCLAIEPPPFQVFVSHTNAGVGLLNCQSS